MDWAWYKRKTADELKGLKVRTTRPLRTGSITVPVGATCEIEGKWAGLELRAAPCLHCGVSIHLTRVPPPAVELVPIGALAPLLPLAPTVVN